MAIENKLDLHGIKHEFVKDIVIRKIEELWNTNSSLHIITGNSNTMQDLVIEVLKEYNLEYRIGDLHNLGYINTTI
jgi:hypothetical protein